MIDLRVPQRQSPLAVVFLGVRIVASLGVVQIALAALFLVSGPFGNRSTLVLFAAFAVLGSLAVLSWWRFTFQFVDGELVVAKGVLWAERLTVPIDRIQSIAIEQELLHRLTGLVKVTVDTAGSSVTELTIAAVARPVAEQLERQAVVAPGRIPGPAVEPGDRPAHLFVPVDAQVVVAHDPRRLLLAALTLWPWSGLVVLGPLIAGFNRLPDDVTDLGSDLELVGTTSWRVVSAIAALVAIALALNVARVFLRDFRLTLTATPTGLQRTSGLLSLTRTASSVTRVQVVSTAQNPLQRIAGLADIELSTIGHGDIRLIGCDDEQVGAVERRVHPSWGSDLAPGRRIHPAAVRRVVRAAAVVAALIAAGGYPVIGAWSVVALVAVPVVWALARRHVRRFRWALGDELVTSRHVLSRTTRRARRSRPTR